MLSVGARFRERKKLFVSNLGLERKLRHIFYKEPHCPNSSLFVRSSKMNMTQTFVYLIFGLATTTTCPGCGLGTKLR